jgi:hypothetical protein
MSNPTEPLVCTVDGGWKFQVIPQRRWTARQKTCLNFTPAPGQIFACKDEEQKGLVTLDRTLRVSIRELLYPGDTSTPIVDKWIYVILDGAYFAEIYAKAATAWEYTLSPSPAAKLTKKAAGYLLLDPGPEGSPKNYDFFLSPVRLSANARQYLLDKTAKTCIREAFAQAIDEVVEVPDPFHWAADAHSQYYVPRLDDWQAWTGDADRQAKLFIAGILEAMVAADDKAGVKNELRPGEPKKTVDAYKKQEIEHRRKAEEAMAYLAHLIDSHEHRAVEMAAIDAGGPALAICYQQWGIITGRLCESEPGRMLALAVVRNPDRLPGKYLFATGQETPPLAFTEFRYAWLGALAAFENLMPASFRDLKQAWNSVTSPSQLELLKAYLKNVDINKLTGQTKTIARNAAKGVDLRRGIGTSAGAQRRFDRNLDVLVVQAEEAHRLQQMAQTGTKHSALDKLHADYGGVAKGFKASAGTVIELMNFINAVWSYKDSDPDGKQFRMFGPSQLRSLIGAAADLTSHGTGLLEEVIAREGAKRALKGIGGAAGFISGVVDMLQFQEEMVMGGLAKNDYAVAAGKGIAAFGAATVAFGGAMVLCGAIMPASSALGPVGLVAGAIGSVLVIGGCVIANLLMANQYEEFAKHCCFGKKHGGENVYLPWTTVGLGNGSPSSEAKALLDLLANYRLRGYIGIGSESCSLSIYPGYVTEDTIFEVRIRNSYSAVGVLRHGVEVHLGTEQIVQVEGAYPLYPYGDIQKDKNGQIESIRICVDEKHPREYGKGSYFGGTAWIRCRPNGDTRTYIPPDGSWVKVDLISDQNASSLDGSRIEDEEKMQKRFVEN